MKKPDKQKLKFKEFVRIQWQTLVYFWADLKWLMIVQMVFLGTNSLLNFAKPAVLAVIINQLSVGGVNLDGGLVWWLVLLVGLSVLPGFVDTIDNYVQKIAYMKTEKKVELDIVNLQGELDVAHHENPELKDLIQRATEEAQWRMKNFSQTILYVLYEMFSVGIAVVILLQVSWWVVPLLVIAVIPEIIVSIRYGNDVWSIASAQSEPRRMFWNLRNYFTYLPNLLELKLFQNLTSFRNRLDRLFTGFIDERLVNERVRVTRTLVTDSFVNLINAIILVFFVMQVIRGEVLVGTLTFLIATVSQTRSAMSGMANLLSTQYQDGLFVRDFFKLKALKNVLAKPVDPVVLNDEKTPVIEFLKVSFRYPRTKQLVLENFSLVIKPGEKLAIVGVNGAGKTTLVKLLCRFYDPTEGKILVNGVDLRKIDLESWYQQLAIIFQEYSHYQLMVAEGIRLGRWSVDDDERISSAARRAGAEEFINIWPKKFLQMLGRDFSDGVEPSIGQWQKLALARVFYREPQVFVLDEPTASVDAESEAKIFENLEKQGKGKTVLLISHRFSTVRKATKIVVIENGRISEQGTHAQLMSKPKTYARLFKLQAKDYAD